MKRQLRFFGRQRRPEAGFTLVEIAIAVAILGLALTTIIGLQTHYIRTEIEEQHRLQAVFYARHLMASEELEGKAPAEGQKEQDLASALRESGYFQDSSRGKAEALDGWRCLKSITSIDLPPLEDAMRRIDITVSWGSEPQQSYQLVYFVRSKGLDSQ